MKKEILTDKDIGRTYYRAPHLYRSSPSELMIATRAMVVVKGSEGRLFLVPLYCPTRSDEHGDPIVDLYELEEIDLYDTIEEAMENGIDSTRNRIASMMTAIREVETWLEQRPK